MPASRRRAALLLAIASCGSKTVATAPGPDLAVFGDSTRIRIGDQNPKSTPWFDGKAVTLAGATDEPIGIQVVHRGPIALAIDGATTTLHDVGTATVTRPSTAMYGGSHGAGAYADILEEHSTTSGVTYFEIRASTPGTHTGQLVIGTTTYPVTLDIAPFALPLAPAVWAYYDPRELVDAGSPAHPSAKPSPAEASCIATFREYGVVLSPDLDLDSYADRKDALHGFPYIPVSVGDDPATVGDEVRRWIAATKGTGQVPFAIPIDEPGDHEARVRVRAVADAIRAAGGGPTTFMMAVTDRQHEEYGDAIDLYISAKAIAGVNRWVYNGTPPAAGSMVLDAETPGARTWGAIMFRYQIPIWYVWDALYWHDRHNAKRQKRDKPGRPLDEARDATSFDDTEDHGNLDGVLALKAPTGCRATLRLAAIRRGLLDRALLERAATCDRTATDAIAKELVPRALADGDGDAAWPTDEGAWELARRKLLAIAGCAK